MSMWSVMWSVMGLLVVGATTALAQEAGVAPHHSFLGGIVLTVVYSALGIAMACVAFRVIDWITPGDLGQELAEQKNMALAILAGAFVLGVCIIIAAAILG